MMNLYQSLSNPEGALNRLTCGNAETLSQPGIRDSLLAFHKKWYSANIMTLTVQGKEDVETLEKWVRESFSEIENKNVVLPNFGEPKPYGEKELMKVVKFEPVKDKKKLTLLW
jgi:insulysin